MNDKDKKQNDQKEKPKTVGQGPYLVKEGDCLTSIAEETGHFWETIWNDPKNQKLKEKRKDPNIIMPGDKLTIPEKKIKEESKPTGKRHRFKIRGVPAKLEIKILKFGEPRANEIFTLEIDGTTVVENGKTDSEGRISEPIPPGAIQGRLVVGPTEDQDIYTLNLGNLWPIDTVMGIQQRLNSLGFNCGTIDDQLNEQTKCAIANFKAAHDIKPNANLDQATTEKIKQAYGC